MPVTPIFEKRQRSRRFQISFMIRLWVFQASQRVVVLATTGIPTMETLIGFNIKICENNFSAMITGSRPVDAECQGSLDRKKILLKKKLNIFLDRSPYIFYSDIYRGVSDFHAWLYLSIYLSLLITHILFSLHRHSFSGRLIHGI